MIFLKTPPNFKPRFKVASCYVEFKGKILLLFRNSHKLEGNKWGVPAGKIHLGETEQEAMVREIKEETGLEILPEKLDYFHKVYVRYPDYDFVYHIFFLKLDSEPMIKINPREHKEHAWVMPQDALNMKLVSDLDGCIKMYYGV
ncbi:MAG: pyrophosphohydrolase [Parcubacteria group bacterium LiPW_72]|nr:MAG: pyrophosphohydrolase [Parcubacteria group bacterium LiPW_72]